MLTSFRVVFKWSVFSGMASACANPILYGFLNENFKKEFKGMFQTISHNVFVRSETSLETTTEF